MRLTDEEIKYQINLKREMGTRQFYDAGRRVADAQIAKCQSYYASLGEEELKDKVARIIIGKPPKIEDKEGNLIDDPLYEFDLDNERGNVDKILSLILGWKEAQNG